MSEYRPISQLPWQVTEDEFLEEARGVGPGGACCAFVIDVSIPQSARSGYAALVIAYARADEPVCIQPDGSAILLVRDGGADAGRVVARRILDQMRRLALDQTLHAAVVPIAADPATAMSDARAAAEAAAPGTIPGSGPSPG
ncbi:MAG: hypothetical protein JOY80_11520 [Candidatus Dormibacteraeota bacterium]|nr:hypothetical protein [Candidatus Dormibacteraeota bacterium]